MESILTSIKKMLGIEQAYTHFDQDIIMHVNTVFAILHQLGVGTKECFSITDASEVWSSFIEGDSEINIVKTYMHLKVKLIFDPPLSSAVIDVMNRQLSEFEWRLYLSGYLKTNREENTNV